MTEAEEVVLNLKNIMSRTKSYKTYQYSGKDFIETSEAFISWIEYASDLEEQLKEAKKEIETLKSVNRIKHRIVYRRR